MLMSLDVGKLYKIDIYIYIFNFSHVLGFSREKTKTFIKERPEGRIAGLFFKACTSWLL